MPNLEIPTDNLYKFLAIFGLIISIIFGALPNCLSVYTSMLSIDFQTQNDIWQAQVKIWDKEAEDKLKEIQDFNKNSKKMLDLGGPITQQQYDEHTKKLREFEEYSLRLSAVKMQSKITRPKIDATGKKVALFSAVSQKLIFFSKWAFLFGVLLTFIGFLGWWRMQKISQVS